MALDFKEGAKMGGRFAIDAAKEAAKSAAGDLALQVLKKLIGL